MRRTITIFVLALALIAAVVAAAMVKNYQVKQKELAQQGPVLVPVVVSVADVSFGRTLEPGDLDVVMYPEGSVPKGAVSNVDSLIGQTTKVFLVQNEPVLVSKLSSIGGGLSLRIEPTMRAASIQVDKVSGVSGFVLPGDRVDVIAVSREYAKDEALARTILQNVEVLAAGEKTEMKDKEPLSVQSVTLLVDPPGAEALALAANEGKLHLSLRNPNDQELAKDMKGTTKSGLLGIKKAEPEKKESAPPKPATVAQKPAPKPRPDSVTVIRSTKKSQERPAMDTPRSGTDTTRPNNP